MKSLACSRWVGSLRGASNHQWKSSAALDGIFAARTLWLVLVLLPWWGLAAAQRLVPESLSDLPISQITESSTAPHVVLDPVLGSVLAFQLTQGQVSASALTQAIKSADRAERLRSAFGEFPVFPLPHGQYLRLIDYDGRILAAYREQASDDPSTALNGRQRMATVLTERLQKLWRTRTVYHFAGSCVSGLNTDRTGIGLNIHPNEIGGARMGDAFIPLYSLMSSRSVIMLQSVAWIRNTNKNNHLGTHYISGLDYFPLLSMDAAKEVLSRWPQDISCVVQLELVGSLLFPTMSPQREVAREIQAEAYTQARLVRVLLITNDGRIVASARFASPARL